MSIFLNGSPISVEGKPFIRSKIIRFNGTISGMIDILTHKQICCEHCGFEFPFTGFVNADAVVCPVCGVERHAAAPHRPPAAEPAVPQQISPDEFIGKRASTEEPAENTPPCPVEVCPLLTDDETDSTAQKIADKVAERIQLRFRAVPGEIPEYAAFRRKKILTRTITVQMTILAAAFLFMVKPLLLPKDTIPVPEFPQIARQPAVQPAIAKPEQFPPETLPVVSAAKPNALETAANVPSSLPETPPPEAVPPLNHPSLNPPLPVPLINTEPAETVWIPSPEPPLHLPSPNHIPEPVPPPPIDETAVVSPPRTLSSNTVIAPPEPEPPLSLADAEQQLEKAEALAESDPETGLQEIIGAVKIYQELEQPLPDSLYWLLGRIQTALSWGTPLTENSPAVTAMTLSDDNRWLLVQLKDKTVHLWDLKTAVNNAAGDTEGKCGSYLLDSGTAEYVKFIFTPDLRWIFGGQSNGTIRIWDMSLKNPAESVVTFAERVPGLQDLQLSPDGQWLAAYGNSPFPMPLAEHRLLESPPSGLQQAAYQSSRTSPVKETPVYPVLLWNLRQMEDGMLPAAVPLSASQPAQVIRFSPASEYLAVGRKDAAAAVYPLTVKKDHTEAIILRGHQLAVTQIIFAPDSSWIATGSMDNTIGLWELTPAKKLPEPVMLHGHLGWISTLAVDKTGEHLYSGCYDRTIRVWQLEKNRIVSALDHEPAVLELNTGVPESLSLTSDGGKLIVLGNDGSLGIYSVPLLRQPEDRRSIIFRNSKLSIRKNGVASDGSLLIFSYDNLADPSGSGIRLWHLHTPGLLRQ
ncbi:MAG: hypothetical protein LBH00_10265 [Planctomycetaceae bacterium]|nr:hypothetical protein [Planctomycetaceae bacterium]